MADIRFLGKPHMEGWERPATPEGWKPFCLLAYLCLDLPVRLHTDTELARLLWPEVHRGLGQRKVDAAVTTLNRVHGATFIERTRYGEYEVVPSAVSIDVWAFRGGVRMRRREDALTLYRGDLLEGIDLPDAPQFMEWLDRQRRKYCRLASLCAWRSHQQAAEQGEAYLSAGLAVLAYKRSPDPAPMLKRVMTSLRDVGAEAEALRLLQESRDIAADATRLAAEKVRDPTREHRRRVPIFPAVSIALLFLLLVLALPRMLQTRPPPGESAATAESGSASARAPSGLSAGSQPQAERVTPAPPPSPETIWELANRQMAKGAFSEAGALFRVLLGHPRFGEAARTRDLLCWSATRNSGETPPPRRDAVGSARAASALRYLREGDVEAARSALPPRDAGTRGLAWLAHVYMAIHEGPEALVTTVEAAPDTVFNPTEGPLDRDLFLGWSAAAAGDPTGAQQYYRSAADRARAATADHPDDPWRHRNLALALTALGDSAAARASLARAESLAALSPDVLLDHKILEAKALMAPYGSEARRALTDSLLIASYPWPLDSLQMSSDPRWSPAAAATTAPPRP